ncbi:MAG: hypothetical protein RSD96_03815 [Bacilli bacterium]
MQVKSDENREYIYDSIKDRLGVVVEKSTGMTFERFYNELSDQITLLNVKSDEYNKLKRRMKVTKSRWIEKLLSEDEVEMKELFNSCNLHYEQVKNGTVTLDQFKSFFKVDNPIEYKKKILGPIYSWASNESSLLSDYRHFEKLSIRSKLGALKNDILFLYKKYIFINDVSIEPSVLSIFAFDTTNRSLMFSEAEISKQEIENLDIIESFSYNDESEEESLIIMLEKNRYLRSKQGQTTVDVVTQIALLKLMKYFNSIDRSIISYFFKLFSYKAILERKVDVTIAEITKSIGLVVCKKNNEAVMESLIKLGGMKLEYNNKDSYLGGSLFDVFINKKQNKETNKSQEVTVICGTFLNDLMFMNSSYNFDTVVYESLNSTSQHYALWLQKRRLNVIVNDSVEEEEIPFDVMTSPIRWNSNRSDRQRDKILETLEELKENKLIIKDYSYDKKKGKFKIIYIPLPKQVIKGISSNRMNTGMFVDGKILKLT